MYITSNLVPVDLYSIVTVSNKIWEECYISSSDYSAFCACSMIMWKPWLVFSRLLLHDSSWLLSSSQFCLPNVRWVEELTTTLLFIWSILAVTVFVLTATTQHNYCTKQKWHTCSGKHQLGRFGKYYPHSYKTFCRHNHRHKSLRLHWSLIQIFLRSYFGTNQTTLVSK